MPESKLQGADEEGEEGEDGEHAEDDVAAAGRDEGGSAAEAGSMTPPNEASSEMPVMPTDGAGSGEIATAVADGGEPAAQTVSKAPEQTAAGAVQGETGGAPLTGEVAPATDAPAASEE